MAMSGVESAFPYIESYFRSLSSGVFTKAEISAILKENRGAWQLSKSVSLSSFIEAMLKTCLLKRIEFKFPSRTDARYVWEPFSEFSLYLSLRTDSYLSHFTAAYLNDLTKQVPKVIYLNVEQAPPAKRESKLDQTRIDSAFKRNVRVTKNIASFDGRKVCILNGMGTQNLGVENISDSTSTVIRSTGIERTLIDAAVRPVYCGGIQEVLNIYRAARGRVSVNRLVSTLNKMSFIYPYHQVIGYYLDKAGDYNPAAIRLLEDIPKKVDFYLTHGMKETEYSPKWKLHFPKGF